MVLLGLSFMGFIGGLGFSVSLRVCQVRQGSQGFGEGGEGGGGDVGVLGDINRV